VSSAWRARVWYRVWENFDAPRDPLRDELEAVDGGRRGRLVKKLGRDLRKYLRQRKRQVNFRSGQDEVNCGVSRGRDKVLEVRGGCWRCRGPTRLKFRNFRLGTVRTRE